MSNTSKYVTLKLTRSLIGVTEKQRSIVRGLGLRKVGSLSKVVNTPSVKGMINKINHMIQVIE